MLQGLKPEGQRFLDDIGPRSNETPVYNAIVPAKASANGNDQAFEFQIILTKSDGFDTALTYKAQWTKSGSHGRDPEMPRLKERLPFYEFLTKGNTNEMRTPDDVIKFVQTLYNGYGIRIQFE